MLQTLRKYYQNCIYKKPKLHKKYSNQFFGNILSKTDRLFVLQPALSPDFHCLSLYPMNTGLEPEFPVFLIVCLFSLLLLLFFKENVSGSSNEESGPFHFKLIITEWLEKNIQANCILLTKRSLQCKEEFSWFWDHNAARELLYESHNPAEKDERNLKVNLGTLEI